MPLRAPEGKAQAPGRQEHYRRAHPMDDLEPLRRKLEALKTEHRDLDDVIERIGAKLPFDQLQLQRLKKRKLQIKDQIAKLESQLLPDIIA